MTTVRSLTFLFTDVEGSTRLWQDAPAAMSRAIERHDALLGACVSGSGGNLVKSGSRGDGALAVFTRASDAISCAVELQRAFATETWPEGAGLRIRAAVHSGEAETRDDDYFGPTLSRAARLMSIAHGGQALVSAAASEAAKDSMPAGIALRDLGSHRLKDLTQPERVAQIVAPGLREEFPALTSSISLRQTLPTALSSFVGRGAEMTELQGLLGAARLVTVTGVGGAGKTRLAVETAARHADQLRDGVTFIDLAPVRDGASVARVFVTAVDVHDPLADAAIDDPVAASQALTDHLIRVLVDREALLLVDNCEHVVGSCAQVVTTLLASCNKLRVLATSREPLGVAGEQVYRVPPLAPPSATDSAEMSALRDVESVRLFCDRAQAVRSDFQLTADNAEAVATICRQLDGIPLAIELAAARTSVLAPAQIADRLAAAPELLAAAGRDVVDRHKTLEATLEWSYALLDDDERVLLRRLSVFTGGWSLDAAEAVCADEPLKGADILPLLSRLVDRSLVAVRDDAPGVRYRLLEPVRQFADRKVVAADETASTKDRHCAWFVRQAGDDAFMLYTSEARLAELRPEIDNFRSAARWAIDRGDATSALRIATPLNGVFVWLGQRTEGDAWLSEALAIGEDTISDLRAAAIGTLAANLDLCGDVRRAVDLQRRAGEMFAALDNRPSLLWSHIYLAHGLHFCAEYEEEDHVYRRAYEMAVEVGDKVALSLVPFLRTWLYLSQGDVATARELCRQVHDAGDDGHAGVRLGVRVFDALLLFLTGHCEEASHLCDEPIATLLAEFVDAAGNEDPMGLWTLNLVGVFELTAASTRERGRARLADLLPRARRTGLLAALPSAFDSIAALAQLDGRPGESARLYGAVHQLRQTSGIEMRYALTQPMVEEGQAAVRTRLGEATFAAAWESGTRLPLLEAIDLAAELVER